MERNPLVSVIMPAYNAELYIQEAIRSALQQTHQNIELLVIDDGSTDGTCRIVEEFAQSDKRVFLYRNEQNAGVAASRNRGFSLARGDYIALLDSDDRWYPDKIDKQLQRAESSQADLIYTSYALISEDGQEMLGVYRVPEQTNFKQMLGNNVIGCSTVMLSRRIVEQYRFSTDYHHEDYALWLEMICKGYAVRGIGELLVDYRVRASSRAGNKRKSALSRWRIYRDLLRLPLLPSVKYMAIYAVGGFWKYYKRCWL